MNKFVVCAVHSAIEPHNINFVDRNNTTYDVVRARTVVE